MRKKVSTKKKVTFTRWDPVENLTSEEAIAAYLEAAMEEAGDDPAYIAAVLGDIAKARGIQNSAEGTGMTTLSGSAKLLERRVDGPRRRECHSDAR